MDMIDIAKGLLKALKSQRPVHLNEWERQLLEMLGFWPMQVIVPESPLALRVIHALEQII